MALPFLILLAILVGAFGQIEPHDCNDVKEVESQQWVIDGGFIPLILVILMSFWAMASACEDYYVPALKVLCNEWNIPDTVAGATFMAAGASSPELFVSLSALFIEDSSVGLGAVVGSEIFNHLCIPAMSIFYAKGGRLNLDYRILTRDVVFYFLQLMLLVVAIKSKNPNDGYAYAFNHDSWDQCLEVNTGYTVLLMAIYVLYAIVTIYFSRICTFLKLPSPSNSDAADNTPCGANINMSPAVPLILDPSLQSTATGNPMQKGKDLEKGRETTPARSYTQSTRLSMGERALQSITGVTPTNRLIGFTKKESNTKKPDGSFYYDLCMHMEVRSEIFAKLRLYRREWSTWYFTLGSHALTCRRYEEDPASGEHVQFYSLLDVTSVQAVRVPGSQHTFQVAYDDGNKVTFRCFSPDAMNEMMSLLHERVDEMKKLPEAERRRQRDKYHNIMRTSPADVESLMDLPHQDGTLNAKFNLVWYYFTWPLRILLWLTLYDMRIPSNANKYGSCILACVAWLFVLSLLLIQCCSLLGAAFGISETIIGITIAAIGTSFPNLWSSVVVARDGLGDMAVSNSLGSNIFNVGMGLGIPWFLYTVTVTEGKAYNGILDGGVIMFIFLLIIVLALYYVNLVFTNFTMYPWMAYMYIVVYFIVVGASCAVLE